MRVTFDTNTLESAVRPERHSKDPRSADFYKVHDALKAGILKGYFSETIVTLEGIEKKDRSDVMGGTHVNTQMTRKFDEVTAQETINITMTPEQDRKPLHPEHFNRIQAAREIGMRALKAPPRVGGFRVPDPDFYEPDSSEAALSERINKAGDVSTAIEARGVGYALVKSVADEFAKRDGVANEMPMQSLGRAQGVHEEGRVKRAVSEWADADSMAAHVGYGIELFCTEDEGKSAGAPSVLDATNRAWLETTYGVKFVNLSQLAGML